MAHPITFVSEDIAFATKVCNLVCGEETEPKWTLDTRYFTADIEIKVDSSPKDASGIVIVLFQTVDAALKNVVQVMESATEASQIIVCVQCLDEDCDVKILEKREKIVDFVFDRDGEIIFGDFDRKADASQSLLLADDADESNGCSAILTSLMCHDWPQKIKKSQQEDKSRLISALNHAAAATSGGVASAADNADGEEEEDKYDEDGIPKTDVELEGEMLGLERLFEQMMEVRQRAKEGSIGDEERREKASDLIMKLMRMMGDDGEDEDESEGEIVN